MTNEFKISTNAINARIARVGNRSWSDIEKYNALKKLLNVVDLTTLEGVDTPTKIQSLCKKALKPSLLISDIPTTAAVCVYPNMVQHAYTVLKAQTEVRIASVSTAFPSGQSSFEVKKMDTLLALENGADEIDMVISRGKFLSNQYSFVFDEIAAIKELCGTKKVKVILETGELQTLENVRKASEIAIAAGADFIKTSTGKIQPAATLPVTLVMLRVIREYYQKTGVKIGMKPAGGISNSETALIYYALVQEELGEEWLNNDLFRIGASSLVGDLVLNLESFYKKMQ